MAAKSIVSVTILLLFCCITIALNFLYGQSNQDQEDEIPRVAPEVIQQKVQQLGDQKYAARQAATTELVEIGEPAIPALLVAASNRDDAEIRWRSRELVRAILMQSKVSGIEWVYVDAGEFQMGSPTDEKNRRADEIEHGVRITEPFLLGKHEVTQREFTRVMKYNPSRFKTLGGATARTGPEDPSNFPVESVSWFDAIEFCNRLSSLERLAPYYKLRDIERDGTSVKHATVEVIGGRGYRLPTEAEWEYACRAATKSRFYFGEMNSGREANLKPEMTTGGYGGTSPRWRDYARPTEVGSYPLNPWGLADMHGNINEWCWDWYDKDYYALSPAENPLGPATGTTRVLRGGSWLMQEDHARSASRMPLSPQERKEFAGFRVARSPQWKFDAKAYFSTQSKR